jgi:hypothetical protein
MLPPLFAVLGRSGKRLMKGAFPDHRIVVVQDWFVVTSREMKGVVFNVEYRYHLV